MKPHASLALVSAGGNGAEAHRRRDALRKEAEELTLSILGGLLLSQSEEDQKAVLDGLPPDRIQDGILRCAMEACLAADPLSLDVVTSQLDNSQGPRPREGWGTFLSGAMDRQGAMTSSSLRRTCSKASVAWSNLRTFSALAEASIAAENGADIGEAVARLRAALATEEAQSGAVAQQVRTAFLTAADLLEMEPLPYSPVLAGGVFSTATYGLLYGPDGSGKSLAALHLAVCLAAGKAWFGLETAGPASVAIISTDDDRDLFRQRLEPILARENADAREIAERIHLLARPWPWGSLLDLLDPSLEAVLTAYLRDHGCRLLVIDHLSACHGLPPHDYRPLICVLDRIAQAADCAVLAVAHPPKAGLRAKDGEAAADDVYGDSRLRNYARLRVRMAKTDRPGLYRMVFEKVSRAGSPPDAYLTQDPSDPSDPSLFATDVVAKAKAGRADRIARMRTLVEERGRVPATDMMRELGVTTDRALRKYCAPAGVTLEGRGEDRAYVLAPDLGLQGGER